MKHRDIGNVVHVAIMLEILAKEVDVPLVIFRQVVASQHTAYVPDALSAKSQRLRHLQRAAAVSSGSDEQSVVQDAGHFEGADAADQDAIAGDSRRVSLLGPYRIHVGEQSRIVDTLLPDGIST